MKTRIFLAIVSAIFSLSVNAQIVKILNGETTEATYVNNKSHKYKVVIEDTKKVSDINITTPKDLVLPRDVTSKLTWEVLPDDADEDSVLWSSSDTNIARVDANGNVTGVNVGKATITATAFDGSGVTDTYDVTVALKVTKIDLSVEKNLMLPVGKSSQISCTIYPTDAPDKSLTWTSSNPKVATVDENGKITGVGTGSAVLTATANDGGGATATYTVNVMGWVQLWAGGPKFAVLTVGQKLESDDPTGFTFTDATKTGEDYVWGKNWRTPTKDEMAPLHNDQKVSVKYEYRSWYCGFVYTGKESGYTGNSMFLYGAQSPHCAEWEGSAQCWTSTSIDTEHAWNFSIKYEMNYPFVKGFQNWTTFSWLPVRSIVAE